MTKLIKKLNNPTTFSYNSFKTFISTENFPWYYSSYTSVSSENSIEYQNHVNLPYYFHHFLVRPDGFPQKTPIVNSEYFDTVSNIFLEIFEHNNIKINYFLRICANCVHPSEQIVNSVPHIDHLFEHKNAIIYLTNAGGSTLVGNDSHNPKEDDVIIFGGELHYHQTPLKDRRIVLVATFN